MISFIGIGKSTKNTNLKSSSEETKQMACGSRKILLFIACGLLVAASATYITANVLPLWGKISFESATVTAGLWKLCSMDNNTFGCMNFPQEKSSANDKMMTARAFITISCILSSLSVLSIILHGLFHEDSKRKISILAIVLSIGSLFGGIIGVAVGISFIKSDVIGEGFTFGLSSILGIVAIVLNFIGVIITLFI